MDDWACRVRLTCQRAPAESRKAGCETLGRRNRFCDGHSEGGSQGHGRAGAFLGQTVDRLFGPAEVLGFHCRREPEVTVHPASGSAQFRMSALEALDHLFGGAENTVTLYRPASAPISGHHYVGSRYFRAEGTGRTRRGPATRPGLGPGHRRKRTAALSRESLLVLGRRGLGFGPFQCCDDVSFVGQCLLFGRGEVVVGVGGDGHG